MSFIVLTIVVICSINTAAQATVVGDMNTISSSDSDCQLSRARTDCENYNIIQAPLFHAFLGAERLDALCPLALNALDCAAGLNYGCLERDWITFEVQRTVLNVMCITKRDEYKKASKCFSLQALQERFSTVCMKPLTGTQMSTDPCSLTEQVTVCTTEFMNMRDECTEADITLMEELVKNFLDPSVGLLCQDSKNTGQPEGTTPSSSKEPMVTLEGKESSTISSGHGQETTPKNSASSLQCQIIFGFLSICCMMTLLSSRKFN